MKVKIYDTECFINMFLGVYKDWSTKEKHIFETSDRKNQDYEHKEFLKAMKGGRMIGFNNLNYDWPLLDFYLKSNCSLEALKAHSDKLISTDNAKFNRIRYPIVEQVDVFAIRHYDNKAKSANLKKIQISMDWWNVKDSSEDFSGFVTKHDEVIEYCDNDTDSTFEFIEKSLYMIRDRQTIKKETGIDCLNYPDSKLGEQLILAECAEYHKCSIQELYPREAPLSIIPLKDIVFDWISFETPLFQDILEQLKTKSISSDGQIEFSFVIDDVEISVKEGGIHGSLRGSFESDDVWIIKDGDVGSMHPRSMAVNEIFPKHIGKIFSQIIGRGYDTRMAIKPKLKDKSIDKAMRDSMKKTTDRLKLQMNSAFGKLGDRFSALYDPPCVYKVTINNQLFAMKWIELLKTVPTLTLLYINTDGITCRLKREYLPEYDEACRKFAEWSKFQLEFETYNKLHLRDVNNYCAVNEDGEIKTKGEYVYEVKEDYHKVINFRVARKAAVDYLLFGKPFEQSIENEKNIFLFTGSVRFKKKRTTKFNNDDNDLAESEYDLDIAKQSKAISSYSKGILYSNEGETSEVPPNLRFIFSKNGRTLWKVYDKVDKKTNKSKMAKMFENKQIFDCNMIRPEDHEFLLSIVNKQHYVKYARNLVNSMVAIDKLKGGIKMPSNQRLF